MYRWSAAKPSPWLSRAAGDEATAEDHLPDRLIRPLDSLEQQLHRLRSDLGDRLLDHGEARFGKLGPGLAADA